MYYLPMRSFNDETRSIGTCNRLCFATRVTPLFGQQSECRIKNTLENLVTYSYSCLDFVIVIVVFRNVCVLSSFLWLTMELAPTVLENIALAGDSAHISNKLFNSLVLTACRGILVEEHRNKIQGRTSTLDLDSRLSYYYSSF